MKVPNAERRQIRSIGVGFRLITCLEAAAGPMSLKELSIRAGMSPSQAHLYLASFAKIGLVLQDSDTSRYHLGPYAVQLGLAALHKMDVLAIAREPMQALQRRTGESVYLSVWGNRGPSIVQKVDGTRPIPMSLRVGYVLPVLSSATGRIFLAHLPHGETASVLKAEIAEQTPRAAKPSADKIAEIGREVRRIGLARTDSLLNNGFVGISAPIFDHAGELCAAVTLIGPSGLLDVEFDGPDALALKESAAEISARLGYRAAAAAGTSLPATTLERRHGA